jgi:DNA segregation ATPase FtsK/SpoIIIE, S-DNA-T family
MLGVVFYLLHITIIRNFILLMVVGVALFFTNNYDFMEQFNQSNIKDLEVMIFEFLNSSTIPYFFELLIALLIGLNILNIIEIILFYDYISLPYSVGLFHKVVNLNNDNRGFKTILDRFSFFTLLFSNGKRLTYTNRISLDKSRYEENIEQIREFFQVPQDSEVIINQTSKKSVDIEINHIPKYFELDTNKIIENKIYLGQGFNNKDLYIPFENLTHILTVGESGSGKSVLINLLLLSVFKNLKMSEKLYLVDFKSIEFYRYKDIEKVEYLDQVEDFIPLLENLTSIMIERYNILKQENKLKWENESIFVVIDEIGSIGTHSDKKVRDTIFSLLTNLLQKSRAAGIFFLVFSQKIEISVLPTSITSNIQGKILLKTDNDYNQNQTIGTKEVIEKITNIEPGNFNRGRGIFKCGISSDTALFQVPMYDKDTYKDFI